MLPQEILVFLVETFWKGRWSYVRESLKDYERRRNGQNRRNRQLIFNNGKYAGNKV